MFDDILVDKHKKIKESTIDNTTYFAICPICSSYCSAFESSNDKIYAICYVCSITFEI